MGGWSHDAQLVKIYGASPEPEHRYSPAGLHRHRDRHVVMGCPDRDRISTSYVERADLSIRMGLRRFTRLTNAHSKKVKNHHAALAIYFLFYNFARPNEALRTKRDNRITPAMAAGVAHQPWAVEDIVRLLEMQERGEGLHHLAEIARQTTAARPGAARPPSGRRCKMLGPMSEGDTIVPATQDAQASLKVSPNRLFPDLAGRRIAFLRFFIHLEGAWDWIDSFWRERGKDRGRNHVGSPT